jgi:hypothetical protein
VHESLPSDTLDARIMNDLHGAPARTHLKFLSSLCLLLFSLSTGFGSLLNITHSTIGSGTVGALSFTNASITISELADPSSRVGLTTPNVSGFSIQDLSATISISGLGLFHFTSPTRTFVNNTFGVVGFSRSGANLSDLLDGPTAAPFFDWDMLGPVGPITGPGQFVQWTGTGLPPITTDIGILIFNDASPSVTFQVTLVPEPSSAAFLSLFLIGFAIKRRAHAGINKPSQGPRMTR